jgi:hypothetical protein
VRDPDNQYDFFAIKVFDANNNRIGFIRRGCNKEIAERLDAKEPMHGVITSIELVDTGRKPWHKICIQVYSDLLEDAELPNTATSVHVRRDTSPTQEPKPALATTVTTKQVARKSSRTNTPSPVRIKATAASPETIATEKSLLSMIGKFFGTIFLGVAILAFLVFTLSQCAQTSTSYSSKPPSTKPSTSTTTTRPPATAPSATPPRTGSSTSSEDAYNAWLEDNAIEDGEYNFDVEGGDWESVDPPERNPASGYKPEWDKYYEEDFPEVD